MPIRNSRRRPSLGLVAAITALILSACGSSSSSSSTHAQRTTPTPATPSTPAPSASHATGAAFTIGRICTCSGPAGGAGDGSVPVVAAWVKHTNAHGGLNGHPVNLITLDDAGSPTTSLQDAHQLIQGDHVMALVGGLSTASAAWASYAQQSGVPVIGDSAFNPPAFTNPDFYPVGAAEPAAFYGEVALAKSLGRKHIATFYCAEVAACSEIPKIIGVSAKLIGGITQVAQIQVSATAPSYAAPCLAAKSNNADALLIATAGEETLRIGTQCQQEGDNALIIGGGGTFVHNVQPSAFDHAALVSFNLPLTDTTTPGGQLFHQIMSAEAPGFLSSQLASETDSGPFAGLQMFKLVAGLAHLTPTSAPADVKRGLYMVKNQTLGGLSGPITYEPGKPTLLTCYFTTEKNGTSWTANPTPQCVPPATLAKVLAALG